MLEQGKNGTHFFMFTNAGDEPLRISKIKTSCGCTASSTEKKLFEPGEKGNVKVVYKTKNRSGPFRQKIRVFTNDPDNPEANLNIRGVVKLGPAPAIAVKKPHVELGVFTRDRVAVSGGVAAGDRVVVSGHTLLFDGRSVEVAS